MNIFTSNRRLSSWMDCSPMVLCVIFKRSKNCPLLVKCVWRLATYYYTCDECSATMSWAVLLLAHVTVIMLIYKSEAFCTHTIYNRRILHWCSCQWQRNHSNKALRNVLWPYTWGILVRYRLLCTIMANVSSACETTEGFRNVGCSVAHSWSRAMQLKLNWINQKIGMWEAMAVRHQCRPVPLAQCTRILILDLSHLRVPLVAFSSALWCLFFTLLFRKYSQW